MTEGRYWSTMLRPALLRERQLMLTKRGGWTLWKHCDKFSAGILDFSLSLGKHTEWYELKIYPREETELQKFYRKRLEDGAHLIVVNANLCSYAFDGEAKYFFNSPKQAVTSLATSVVMSTYE